MMKKNLRRFTHKPYQLVSAIVIVGILIVGGYFITHSRASTPAASIESESGNRTGNMKLNLDGSASGYVNAQFGTLTNRSRLGVDINALPKDPTTNAPLISIAQAYSKIAEIGFGWVRTGPGFSSYDNLNPSNFDAEIAEAKKNNLKIMAVLTYAYGTLGACGDGHCAPKDPAAWARYAGQLVAHWKATNPGVVTAVEVWNEANNPQFWDPVDPARYTDLLRRTALEVKSKDPNMLIIASGTSPGGGNQDANATSNPINPATFYKQMYVAGAKNFFDAAANHPYETTYKDKVNQQGGGQRNTFYIRKVLAANGESGKQIWNTESGTGSCWQTSGGNSTFTEQQRSNRLSMDLDDFWYGLHDPNTGATVGRSDSGGDWNVGPHFVFKLYKAYQNNLGDGSELGYGLIYNTKSLMRKYSKDTNEPLCTNPPSDYYEPTIIQALKLWSAKPQ